MSNAGRIWFNGRLREAGECMVHVGSHALHYGSSVFEGIRAYETPDGTRIFRGKDHLRRLKFSADVYRMPLPYGIDDLHAACRETVRDSGLASAYIRPLVARGNCGLGVMPKKMDVIDVAIIVSAWGAYLEAWNQCGRELMDFAAARLRKDTELGESLAKCRSWDETAEVHNDWMRATFDDYARETEKVMAIMNTAASRSQEAQAVATGAKARRSAASAASSDA